MAKRLAALYGFVLLHWALSLEPVATGVLSPAQALAHHVETPDQVLWSTGLLLQRSYQFCAVGTSALPAVSQA